MLLEREQECRVLEFLLAGVRDGSSGVLVLRGEAGIGKTALLEHAAQSAADMHVARVTGVESEMELGFAGLHQLLVPFLDGLGSLPVPQREALGAVFGLAARHKVVVTMEDHGVAGGIGSAVSAALRRSEIDVPCRDVGVGGFVGHIEAAHLVTLELVPAVHLVVPRNYDVVEVDVDGHTGDARVVHSCSSRRGRPREEASPAGKVRGAFS